MATLRAPKKPINQPVVFFASLADRRKANGQDTDLQYVELFTCPADDQLADALTGYVADDGQVYCSRDCAAEVEAMESVQ